MSLIKYLLIIAVSCCVAMSAFAETVQTATVDLLLQRQHVHNVVIDDKREVVYFERIGPKAMTEARFPYSGPASVKSALKKIYAAPIGSGEAKLLFDQDEAAGYFFASSDPWSPDGRYLAIYRLKEGKVQPGVFDLRRSRARFFDVDARYEPFGSSLFWFSDREFAVVIDAYFVDETVSASWLDTEVTNSRSLAKAREKGWRNGEVTVEIVGAGKYNHRLAPGAYDVVVVNIRTGKSRLLAKGAVPVVFTPEAFSRKAVIREDTLIPQSYYENERSQIKRILSVLDFSNGEKTQIESLGVRETRLRLWSISGKYLLVERTLAATDGKQAQRTHAIVDVDSVTIVEHLPAGASNFVWVGDRLAYSLGQERKPNQHASERGGIAIRVDTPPPVAASADSFYYLDNGDLWRAGVDGVRENLTSDYPHDIQLYIAPDRRFLWPTAPSTRKRMLSLNDVRFFTESDGRRVLIIFSEDGANIRAMPFPEPQSQVLATTEQGAVFVTNAYGTGSQLHYVSADEKNGLRLLYHFNKHLADVAPSVGPIRINHKGYDGRDVAGWLYLPPGASLDEPKSYPLVVVSYPGHVYEQPPVNKMPYTLNIWSLLLHTNTPMEVFAAHGYAVLLPSVPIGKRGGQGEPMMRIMPAVLSAVDSSIETGFVDPNRLALSGQSFGGYGALSVAVQTDRFKAIIAMASVSNFISFYGQFPPNGKIGGAKHNPPGGAYTSYLENGQSRMGATPWGDPDRYIRNSPMFHADKATTPIMLIHGDLDYSTLLAQAEEMFTALHREGKDVLFVKYLGEQHVIVQPQNQLDMWSRVFSFLEGNGVAPE